MGYLFIKAYILCSI